VHQFQTDIGSILVERLCIEAMHVWRW